MLFILFINDLLDYLPEGVQIPGVKSGEKCSALLFADDIAGLAEDPDHVDHFLEGLHRWSTDWCMPVGTPKCGVMMVGGSEEEQVDFAECTFMVGEKQITVV